MHIGSWVANTPSIYRLKFHRITAHKKEDVAENPGSLSIEAQYTFTGRDDLESRFFFLARIPRT
jgi:hypothetical protein